MSLRLALHTLFLESCVAALRNVGQVDFRDAVTRALEQAHLLLAQSQDIKLAVTTEERQQGLDMEPLRHYHQFLKGERQAIEAEHRRRYKQR